jgi:hypothetical protein
MIDGDKMTVEDYNEILKVINDLEDYPLLDEDDYSDREYNATIENIKGELHSATFNYQETKEYTDMDSEKAAGLVYHWLSDNNDRELESSDDTGGYPSTESITKALLSLKLIKDMED